MQDLDSIIYKIQEVTCGGFKQHLHQSCTVLNWDMDAHLRPVAGVKLYRRDRIAPLHNYASPPAHSFTYETETPSCTITPCRSCKALQSRLSCAPVHMPSVSGSQFVLCVLT